MIKKIIIKHDSGSESVFVDEMKDNKTNTEYAKELSKILTNSNVTIIETSNKTLLVRPSQVISISVEDIHDIVEEPPDEIIDDIITDMDE